MDGSITSLINKAVYTQRGLKLGKVIDVYIEVMGQNVVRYEVKPDSLIKNLLKTRLLIHRNQIISIREDRIIVEDPVAQEFKNILEKKNLLMRPTANSGEPVIKKEGV